MKPHRTIADKQLFANYTWAPEHRTGDNKLISLKGNMQIIISFEDDNLFLWFAILHFLETNSHVAYHRDWFIISGLILRHSFLCTIQMGIQSQETCRINIAIIQIEELKVAYSNLWIFDVFASKPGYYFHVRIA